MPTAPASSRLDRLPAPYLPVFYFALAHLSLAAAFLVVALDPAGVAGFFYHPRIVFVVHLVTVGWITSSILGALYLVGPVALHTPMPAAGTDYGSFALYVLGGSGVIFHFWIDELSGVGLSAVVVVLAVGQIGAKFLMALDPRVPAAVQAHFTLAFANFVLAALWGMLLAFNKLVAFLPGYVLTNVFAHAHLAALGWATMTVFAAGYRLLPMFLPSAMPGGAGVWTSAIFLETGLLGLAVSLHLKSPWLRAFAVVTVAGIAAFFVQVAWMRRHPRPSPKMLRRPDWGVALALQALVYLAVSAVLGLVLVFSSASEVSVRLILVYGTCGLVGFLAQIVAGVSGRLLPIYAWLRASAEGPPELSPHELPDRRLQATTFFLWTLGVPLLASGFYVDCTALVAAGAWVLLAAVVAGGAQSVWVLRTATLRLRKEAF